jgi:nucleotide-binding universal stress UspA family protein
MDIRSILLHLDAAPASIGRLTLAHGLADRFDAQVTVMFGTAADAAQPSFAYSAAAALQAAEACEGRHDMERARLQAAHRKRAGEGIWCDVRGDLVHALVAEAAYADMLILGPPTNMNGPDAAPAGVVEAAIPRVATPALVVPHPHCQETLGDRVLIAWDGSLQAGRAVRASLPFLRHAAEVHIATWSRRPVSAPFSRLGLPEWLQRHEIASQTHQRDPAPHVGDALCTMAKELQADLIVMGCYGHGPLRERVFGGATRSVLTTLPAPVLMAH